MTAEITLAQIEEAFQAEFPGGTLTLSRPTAHRSGYAAHLMGNPPGGMSFVIHTPQCDTAELAAVLGLAEARSSSSGERHAISRCHHYGATVADLLEGHCVQDVAKALRSGEKHIENWRSVMQKYPHWDFPAIQAMLAKVGKV